MIKEFKEFISRGNMMDLAVGVIIGAAFTAIVNSLVKDLINPLIGLFIGKIDLSNLKFTVGEATFKYGSFLNAVINFLIIALVVFFLIKLVNKTARLQGFFDLMRGKINTNDSFIQKLQNDVEKYKTNPERRKELMDYQMKLDDMRYIGEKTGKEEERIDAIKKMIRRYRQFNADDEKILNLLTQDYGNDFSQEELKQFIKEN